MARKAKSSSVKIYQDARAAAMQKASRKASRSKASKKASKASKKASRGKMSRGKIAVGSYQAFVKQMMKDPAIMAKPSQQRMKAIAKQWKSMKC